MRRGYALAAILVTALALVAVVAVNVGYTRHVQQQADHRWCDLLTSLDQPQTPATTERGLVIQRKIHRLRTDLEC
jgi:hypothetical protein